MKQHSTAHSAANFKPKPLVLAIQRALPYLVALGVGMATVTTASGRTSDSTAAFTTTQLVRQFTLRNTVTQVSLGLQSQVREQDGVLRGPAMADAPIGAGFASDMGAVPNTVNLPQRDGAGRPLGYCAWNNNATSSGNGFLAGSGVTSPLVYAVVSAGLNGTMETSCAYILSNRNSAGDDFVQFQVPVEVSSVQYKASVSTLAALPSAGNLEGDTRLVRDTNKLYSFTGGAWNPVDGSKFSNDSVANGTGAISYTTGKVTVADFQATAATLTGALSGTAATFSGTVTANTFAGSGAGLTDLNASNLSTGIVPVARGGTGVNGEAAANGTLLIGNGSGFSLGTLAAGTGIGVANSAGSITVSNTGVVSLTGTADQVIASASNGNVVLSLPQSIATNSTPTFGGMMLNGTLTGTTGTFTGAVTVNSLAAQRLNVGTTTGVTYANMIVGNSAMAGAQSGNGGNTALGISTLTSNTSGQFNTGTGLSALFFNTTGNNNNASGMNSLFFNTTGGQNTASGAYGLFANTTGSGNSALGYSAGDTNTIGNNNTFVGFDADATSGALTYATALGSESRVATSNTIALGRNSTADQIVIGTDTRNDTIANTKLYVNGISSFNGDLRGTTATFTGAVTVDSLGAQRLNVGTTLGDLIIGNNAMTGVQSSSGANTAVGINTLQANTTGFENTALGRSALQSNTTGYINTGVGRLALIANTTGIGNTAIGWRGLFNTTTGNNNIAVGRSAGLTNITGSSNTFLGYEADATSGALNQATAIGAGSTVATSNTIALGRNSTTDQVVIGTASRNDTVANTKLYVNGISSFNGDLRGTTATFTGAVTMNSLAAQRLDIGTSAGGVTYQNIIIGNGAMPLTQSGNGANTALGINALAANTGGTNNTAIGHNTLAGNSTGGGNTATGVNALSSNTTGTNNTANGYDALFSNTTGSSNIAIGMRALWFNTTGYNNTVTGVNAMRDNTTGYGNTANGVDALYFNTTGYLNTASGVDALRSNTTGYQNTATGNGALYYNTTGLHNTASGANALLSNTTGYGNTASGLQALYSNTTGFSNTASGVNALYSNTTGYSNTASSHSALFSNTTGFGNSALGANAGDTNTTGTYNTFLGTDADATTAALTYATALGAGSTVATSNTIALGRNSTADQVVIGTASRNDTVANTKLYVNGISSFNGDLRGTTATFTGAVTVDSLGAQRLNVGTSAGGVVYQNLIIGNNAMTGAQSGAGSNTALGVTALASNTSGAYNTAVGTNALSSNTTGTYNTVTGLNTLLYNTTGNHNSATGPHALFSNTTGGANAALGSYAGSTNTTGSNNTFLGYAADATSGALTYATALGSESRVATSNTIALGRNSLTDQVVIGSDSRNDTYANTKLYVNGNVQVTNAINFNNTNGDKLNLWTGYGFGINTDNLTAYIPNSTGSRFSVRNGGSFNGTEVFSVTNTGNATVTGSFAANSLAAQRLDVTTSAGGVTYPNLILGQGAMTGAQSGSGANTAVGISALANNTSGNNNTAVGISSLITNTTGSNNSAYGVNALFSNTTGYGNTASGSNALASNTTGYQNTASGLEALYSNTTGVNNTADGHKALRSNTTGYSNTASGVHALYSNTTGAANTALGQFAGDTNTSGSNNTFLGNDTDATSAALSYATAIGSASTVATNNTIALGRNSTADQVVIGTATRNDTIANTKLYVNGPTNLNGNVRVGGTLTFNDVGGEKLNLYTGYGFGIADNNLYAYLPGSGTRFSVRSSGGAGTEVFTVNGDGNATVTGSLTANSLSAQRLNVGTSAGGVTYQNLIIGNGAMAGAQSGPGANTAVGINALNLNSTGFANTATGWISLQVNTTGYGNTATGADTLRANTTGYYNTANGYFSLADNTTGYNNTATGVNSLRYNTTGTDNTATGTNALWANTTGYQNTATGAGALYSNTTGNQNAALGNGALRSNTTGVGNTANSTQALFNNTTGNNNTGNALNVLYNNTTGSANTGSGSYALFNNTTGYGNTALGASAGGTNTTGSYNTFLGIEANPTSAALSYATAIGASSTVATSNTIALGRNSTADQVVIGTDTRNDTFANTKLYVNGNVHVSDTVNFNPTVGNKLNLWTNSIVSYGFGINDYNLTAYIPNGGTKFSVRNGGNYNGTEVFSVTDAGNAAVTGSLTANSLSAQRLNLGTSAGVTYENLIIGNGAMTGAQSGNGANTAVGISALASNTSGTNNTAVGFNSLISNTSGTHNIAIGTHSLFSNTTGNYNTATGVSTLRSNTTGYYNTATGLQALYSNTTGHSNTASGVSALYDNTTGVQNTATGLDALRYNTSGYNNTASGLRALNSNTTGNNNTASGVHALYSNTTGGSNVALGLFAGDSNTTGSWNTFLGDAADATSGALNYATAIGGGSTVATSNTIALGRNSTTDQVVIGTDSRNDTYGNTKLYVNGNVYVTDAVNFSNAIGNKLNLWTASGVSYGLGLNHGNLNAYIPNGARFSVRNGGNYNGTEVFSVTDTGNVNVTGSLTAQRLNLGAPAGVTYENLIIGNGAMTGAQSGTGANTAVGNNAMYSNSSGAYNTALGISAMFNNTTGTSNTAIGTNALISNTSGYSNTVTGTNALYANTTGAQNTATGTSALHNNTTGVNNTANGYAALISNTTGSHNTASGTHALYSTSTGISNAALGLFAGDSNTSGSNNTFLGADADATSGGLNFATAIGSESRVATSNTIALGRNSTTDQVVIGTASRNDTYGNTKLYVNGNVHVTDTVNFNPTAGNKLNLWAASGTAYGFGINNNNLTAYIPNTGGATRFSIRNGGNYNGTEVFSITDNGNMSLAGAMVSDLNVAQGYAVRFSHANASDINDGKIGAGLFSEGLNIVGVQTSPGAGRKVTVYGDVNVGGAVNATVATLNGGGGGSPQLYLSSGNRNLSFVSNAGVGAYNGLTQNGDNLMYFSNGGFNTGTLVIGPHATTSVGMRMTSGGTTFVGGLVTDSFTTATATISSLNVLEYRPVSSQGAYLQWNRDNSSGITYLMNQRGLGPGGISFGEVTTSNAYTQNMFLDSWGNLSVGASVSATRLNIGTNAGGVAFANLMVGLNAMPNAQSGNGGNAAIGVYALANNTTGAFNHGFGVQSMISNSSGSNNNAYGVNSLYSNTSGSYNTAMGRDAGFTNTTGSANTFLGSNANSTSGNLFFATAIGADSSVATDNTIALGRNSLTDQVVIGTASRNDSYIANTKLFVNGNTVVNGEIYTQGNLVINNTAGGQKIFFGQYGENSDAIYIGRVNTATDTSILQMVLGDNPGAATDYFQIATVDGSVRHSFESTGNVGHSGGVWATSFNVSSDRRLKTNIAQQNTSNVLDRLEQLRSYSYNYIANPDLGTRIGVIAQELQPLFPEAVATNANGMMSVDYNALGAMAAVGVGQLSTQFKALNNTVNEQGQKLTVLDEKVGKHNTRIEALEGWKTEAVTRMDTMQTAIDLNIQKIAENAVAIQSNTKAIERLDDALFTLDGTVKGNTESINKINARWARNFSASDDGAVLTVNAAELKVSNFTAQQMRANAVYTQRLEAEMAKIADLEVNNLRANSAVANTVQAEQVNTGSVQVYAGVGLPALLFAAKADGHYTVSTSALDGSYATATVIVNAGQAKVVKVASEGIDLVAEGNMVKAIAAGKSIKASWIKMG